MFRLIRVRLALSYAGIALLVTLSLGAVLLFRLRDYYAGIELDYLHSNAKAISELAAPLLAQKYSKDVQEAQVSNLAFLSQTRVRILDAQQNVLADSGPWQATKVGLGVVRAAKMQVQVKGIVSQPAASVIMIQKQTLDGAAETNPPLKREPSVIISGTANGSDKSGGATGGLGAGQSTSGPETSVASEPGVGQPDVLFFNAAVPVTNGVYGLSLSKPSDGGGIRSSQKVMQPILDPSGSRIGFVELSESPAYGTEIVNSVASGFLVAGALAILLAITAGWLTSRFISAPLSNLTHATEQMSGGDLSVRVGEASRRDEFGALGKSFNQMAGRIEETIQTLRRFLSDAAHELQTPLTALRTNLELARSESDRLAADRYLGLALDQIDRLQRLVKDLLSLSRLESGNGHETVQPVDLVDMVRQASEPFAARAEQASQIFALDLPVAPVVVTGNRDKLCSALGNLLDNALKFTPPDGSITVRLFEKEGWYCLAVSDTGIGVPPEEIDMLFNRFHRARNAASYPGSGLGLAIVRIIALAHGGSVQAANNSQGGACFTICLPGELKQVKE